MRDYLAAQLFSVFGRESKSRCCIFPIALANQVALQLCRAIPAEGQIVDRAEQIAGLALTFVTGPQFIRIIQVVFEFKHSALFAIPITVPQITKSTDNVLLERQLEQRVQNTRS
jgi:hypothetical protein